MSLANEPLPSGSRAGLVESARTIATTEASSNISPAIAHLAAKAEVAVVGVAGVVGEAGEEDVALQVPASKSIKRPLQPAIRGL